MELCRQEYWSVHDQEPMHNMNYYLFLVTPRMYNIYLNKLRHLKKNKRILEWVSISFSRESSPPRDQTCVFCLTGGFFTSEAPRKPSASLDPLWMKPKTKPWQVKLICKQHAHHNETPHSCREDNKIQSFDNVVCSAWLLRLYSHKWPDVRRSTKMWGMVCIAYKGHAVISEYNFQASGHALINIGITKRKLD